MSVVKNTYSSNQNILPYNLKIKNDPDVNESIIIDDDVIENQEHQVNTSAAGSTVWLKVQADFALTILSMAPGNVTAFSPNHSDFDKTIIKIKSGEVFVIRHNSTPMNDTNQSEVTGYQFGTFDHVYIKIDHNSNSVTIYS
jgi:hypothetical protein